ncbi:hypothetical protein [Paraburkholderia sp. SOS3]|jgi:hypothetical protein|uniref:hypothetical protein n=1 Tax=Paraburkholderia sp. SOS3 TaxID=1926494 RepID=UPI0009474E94|nr:hypothetical protein [Paraburkholderia sp. SOS3]APR36765.1 hypothetical protein BTO02_16680 [Paraburkholderia sp. SOS3]
MALSQPSEVPDSVRSLSRAVKPAERSNNVIPFPLSRVLLPVTLIGQSESEARLQLRSLLHSPLGVYVVGTQVVRDGVRVLFSIAPEDLAFTMHTLIASVPEALIGSLERIGSLKEAH